MSHPAMDTIEMRAAYCNALIDEAKKNDRIVLIDCDLNGPMGCKPFKAAFPKRAINVGIAEANACSIAGGMSSVGMVPFVNTFAVFASRRIYDQIFMGCTYPGLNVKIIGSDPGVSSAYNGGTHMAFEDVGILRVMPNITVLEPSDAVMMKDLIHQISNTYGVHYLRMPRKTVARIYEDGSTFEIGKGAVIREGKDITIMAYGLTVYEALKASRELDQSGISARVVDMFTVKPADKECMIKCARETGAILTVENHQIVGGLGSAVSETLMENDVFVPVGRMGVKDEFGEVGAQEYLMKRFRLTAEDIAAEAKAVIERKRALIGPL